MLNPSVNILLTLGLCLALLVGCGERIVYPSSTGSHAQIDPNRPKASRVVVWGNHPAMVSTIISILQRKGIAVVERAQLQMIFREQRIRLTNTSDDDADVLRVGKLLGADVVIFSEATVKSAVSSAAYVDSYGGASRTDTVYHVSVTVRGVTVETGEIRWSGTSSVPHAVNDPEQAVVALTSRAIARALCPIEAGAQWDDSSGCSKKSDRSQY